MTVGKTKVSPFNMQGLITNAAEAEILNAMETGKEWIGVFITNYDMLLLSQKYRDKRLKFVCYKELESGARMTLATWVVDAEIPRIKTEFWGVEGDLATMKI